MQEMVKPFTKNFLLTSLTQLTITVFCYYFDHSISFRKLIEGLLIFSYKNNDRAQSQAQNQTA